MASSSSSARRTWRYRVFTSFNGSDVRTSFLSHFRKQFNNNGITMFDDQRILRGETISPALTQAIRESRISIVVLSKNYASSSWCLDELLEILKCKDEIGQIVMTVFYGVDPSDVRKQTGEFGIAFNETCGRQTEEERRKWSQALNYVGNIAGEHLLNWDNEAKMIEKIARDVSDKLNVTPSRDFDGMVGLEAHLREMESLLDLDYDEVKFVGITGPAGIGKTTIARALHSRLSNRFQLSCFVDNLRGNYHSGFDEYGLKLRLQEQFLSKILNQSGMRICHLGEIKERLCDLKVLIILDDVNDVKQLEALANENTWFGPGSRIIVTTENKDLLRQHGINNTYHVKFPCREEALEILCRYAFRQSSPRLGFTKLAKSVTWLCDNLPLGLRVMGSSLYGKNEDEWKYMLRRLETIVDRDIEEVLKVGYESLHENEQSLFLHIAVFFNNKDGDLVKAMLADDKKLDIEHGLNILENKSLISTDGGIRMHKLLQQVGIQANQREEPCKRRILIDAQDICHALENETGNGTVSGILFDTTGINEVTISKRALRRMSNLRFLSVYKSRGDGNDRMDIPEEMEFPPLLRLLHWDAYPSKSLPLRFRAENLVELDMQNSQLEYLWQGTQPLKNLKKMNLSCSAHLKELPDLSLATNLERLDVGFCRALVELPSSIGNLQKLDYLNTGYCESLQVIPTHINLSSLDYIYLTGCPKLKSFPVFSTTIKSISLQRTGVEEVAASIMHCSRLRYIYITECRNLKSFAHLPTSLELLDLSWTDIEMIPDCIKDLQRLASLHLFRCTKLKSLPELPVSLTLLTAEDCESLERVTDPFNTPNAQLNFSNSFKLGEEAQRVIIQQSFLDGSACFHGSSMPSEFNHRARGNSLNILLTSSASSTFKACVVISPNHRQHPRDCRIVELWCRIIDNRGWYIYTKFVSLRHPEKSTGLRTKHLCIFHGIVPEVSSEAVCEFYISSKDPSDNYKITECGVQILTNETERSSDNRGSEDYEKSSYEVDYDNLSYTVDYDNSRYEFDDFNDVLEDSEDGLISCDSESDDASDEQGTLSYMRC